MTQSPSNYDFVNFYLGTFVTRCLPTVVANAIIFTYFGIEEMRRIVCNEIQEVLDLYAAEAAAILQNTLVALARPAATRMTPNSV